VQDKLEVIAVPTAGDRGRAKCPYNPSAEFVFTYVSKSMSLIRLFVSTNKEWLHVR